ncbi:YokU family protein [Lederbergia citrea]|uniref:YokU family protein n=1 Tax=Lederbergia citrea TaxID=2833581 RepID=A0A942USG9_9BACI|nr:YokU family protein [Lederbergia citrea]MBS4176654.1 YokU family protein [Lederbergia citrea]MBS4203215.1 YokU family protein [Lederbergia citrea]MBS4222114.1 YokU family protein [Lederbergia citrea]
MSSEGAVEKKCEWCDHQTTMIVNRSVFWELPEGTRAIEITDTPTIYCEKCLMEYQSEKMVKEIEDQLFLIDRTKLSSKIDYESFMSLPRLLKRNYFDFS